VTYGGLTAEGGYNMRVFRSKNPDGPFYDAAGNPAVLGTSTDLDSVGLKVMGNYKFSSLSTAYMACGHNSVLRDDDGKWYLFYHARFNSGTEYHEVRVHSMYFNDEGWPVVSPYENSGDVIAEYGYETADIAGTYEYINHGNDTSSEIHNYSSITLNADGTVSGAVSGTWSQAKDSSAAVLTLDGQKYSGYFLAAQDENGQKVMSFTAVGSNNQTVWGAETTAFTGTERVPLIDYTNAESKLVYNAESASGTGEAIKLCDTDLLSGVSYYITNIFSKKSLDLENGNTTDGTNIQQWTKTGGSQQEWRIIADKDGYCRIVSLADESKCIAVSESSSADGVNIELQAYIGADNQLWKLKKDGTSYGIVSKCSGDTAGLDVYDWSEENGGNINQWNYWGGDCQLWEIEPVHPMVNSGKYTVRNLNSGLFISENSGNAVQSSEMVWTFTLLDDGKYIVQSSDGRALTVENGSADNGANIALDNYSGDDSQKFILQCNKDGSYTLLSVVSDGKACADIYEVSTEDGANICQWEYWGGDGQKFILEPAMNEKAITGDVNADGKFNVSDAVMMQKWLICAGDLTNWTAGDLNKDNIINVFDLCLMKRMLIEQ
jgi:arabinan endo-1,5-alpha-L-arabinosidase